MFQIMLSGFCVRALTSLVQAAPFILAGFATAAVLSRFFGYDGTRKLFGEGTRSALFRAWVIGMLLPVCSLGAIPVIREMRRAGIRGGTIMAFAMSGPLFNPLSLLYGLTLSEPIAIISFAACSLVIVTVVGVIWDWLFPNSAGPLLSRRKWRMDTDECWQCGRRPLENPQVVHWSTFCSVLLASAFLVPSFLQTAFSTRSTTITRWLQST